MVRINDFLMPYYQPSLLIICRSVVGTRHRHADFEVEMWCPECGTKQPIYIKFNKTVINECSKCGRELWAVATMPDPEGRCVGI